MDYINQLEEEIYRQDLELLKICFRNELQKRESLFEIIEKFINTFRIKK